MSRRLIALLSTLLVGTLVLTACPADGGGDPVVDDGAAGAASDPVAEDDTDAPQTVRYYGAANPREADTEAVAYCEEQTGHTIEYINGPESATDKLAQILQFFGAGSGDIDVLEIDVIWPGILGEHLVDLSEPLASSEYVDGGADAYFEAIVRNNTVDEFGLVGLPFYTDAGLLYFRTDLLEEYGFDGPPETWEELEEMATTIQDGEREAGTSDFFGFVWQGNAYEGLTCDALEWQASFGGGEIVESDGTITINNPDAAAAFDMAAGWVGTISPDGVVSYQEEDARNLWQAGNAAFMRNWPYAYSLGQEEGSAIAGNFNVGLLPQGPGEDARNAATLGGWQLAVSRYSNVQDAAVDVALCMGGFEGQKIRATTGSFLPTIGALYEDEEVLEANAFFGELFDVFSGGAVARPSTVTGRDYNEASTIYFTEVNRVLTGQQTGQEAVESIESQLQSLLQ